MIEFLKHVLGGQNQFASGGLLLMIIGGIGVYLRAVPQHLWSWLVEQTTMMITVKDEDAAFRWVKEWFLEQEFVTRIRRVDLDTTLRGADLALIPAPGRHRFWCGNRPFWVWFNRSEETKGWTPRRIESLTFRTIGRDQKVLKRFVDEIALCNKKRTQESSFLYVYQDGWSFVEAYSPRLLESVILKSGEKEALVQDIEKFRASRQRYKQLGVPYHRGYLLYGPPGTGKTSLVSALAAKFGMSIYVVNLTEFSDQSLRNAVNDIPENSVILLEDIDCMRTGKRRAEAAVPKEGAPVTKEESSSLLGVTLSGLLNVLDGFHASENVLFVMTTNRIEVLDPALLRPGRIDYKLFMGEASKSQKAELYLRFFPEATRAQAQCFVEANFAETMAQFQGLLLAMERGHEPIALVNPNSGEGFDVPEPSLDEVAS